MKIYVLLLFVVLASCTKTKINSSIVGKWSLDSIYVGIGPAKWEPAVTFAPTNITFYNDGSFSQNNTIFNEYNHFQLISNDTIRFYNLLNQKQLIVKYSLNDELTIYYNCVEACGEKYRRN